MKWILEEGTGILTEDPDRNYHGGSFMSDYAVPFGYYKGKMLIGKFGQMHSDMCSDYDELKYPGRYWFRPGVLSFWDWPESTSKLKIVIKDINKTLKEANYYMRNYRSGDATKIIDDKELIAYANKIADDQNFKKATDAYKFVIGTLNMNIWGGHTFKKIKPISNSVELDIPIYIENDVEVIDPIRGEDSVIKLSDAYKVYDAWSGKGNNLKSDPGREHVKPAIAKTANIKKMDKRQKEQLFNYYKNKGKLDKDELRMYAMMQRREDVDVYIDLDRQMILMEAPHIGVGDQMIDLEFEKDSGVSGLKRIIKAIMKQEVGDKYGNKFQLKSNSEIDEFIKKLLKNSQVQRILKEK